MGLSTTCEIEEEFSYEKFVTELVSKNENIEEILNGDDSELIKAQKINQIILDASNGNFFLRLRYKHGLSNATNLLTFSLFSDEKNFFNIIKTKQLVGLGFNGGLGVNNGYGFHIIENITELSSDTEKFKNNLAAFIDSIIAK